MAALPTDLGIPGCGPDSMPAFGGLVLRAIALAWTDPDFKEALLYPPGGDASSVLSQWLGYNHPLTCRIPSDHIPIRSWPLFLARELMRDLIETLKAEQST